MKPVKLLLFCLILSLWCPVSQAQTSNETGIRPRLSALDSLRRRMPVEKLYIQTDKPHYTTGDTIWLKAYLLDAAFLTPASKSGLLYIEIANDSNRVLQRRMLPLTFGLGSGLLVADKDIPQGSYTLRAYTSWMRNFGEDYIFKKNFYISGPAGGSWLVHSDAKHYKTFGKDSMAMSLRFTNLQKQAIGLREMQLRLMEGRRTLSRNNVETTADGSLTVNFIVPHKAAPGSIILVAQDLRSEDNRIIIPVPMNRPENIDLQFMPEGGSLVAGIPCRIGFKAIAEDGKGTEISGKIYDSRSKEITSFSTLHKGMGSFEFIPQAGESYLARVALAGGSLKDYPLPPVRPSGTILRLNQKPGSMEVIISATPDLAAGTYYLVAQSRGIPCYGATVRLGTGSTAAYLVPHKLFPTGIARFSLLNAASQPLNERIVFINHHDQLEITLTPEKAAYGTRDSIPLDIQVKDSQGKPVEGNFSLAVADDSQVRADSTENNILTSILLTSDLKGTIEEPGYYFQPGTEQALDNLMLTQGWTGYSWQDIAGAAKEPLYQPEPEFTVQGRVSNALNKGVPGTGISLLSTHPLIVRDTLTDAQGRFSFKDFPAQDTLKFMLQARNRGGKSFNVGIEADEFIPPLFSKAAELVQPWYLNSDTALIRQISTTISRQQEQLKLPGNTLMLKEVTITAKKAVQGSKNLNGPGEADQVLDEKDMEKAKKMTLGDMLLQKVEGFRIGHIMINKFAPDPNLYYLVAHKRVRLVFDGIDVDKYYIETGNTLNEYMKYLDTYMNYYTAEDILGIEVMYNTRYNNNYNFRNLDPAELKGISAAENRDYAYIEITTRSGKGPFLNNTPGIYLYKPMPFAGSKAFYRPKYDIKKSGVISDLRSTIHWEPNVFTDASGKAQVSFYSADRPGSYTVIIEGTDLDGRIGYQRGKITVAPK